MSEIRFLTSSDEHVVSPGVNPGYRRDDYHSAIMSKLEWQGKAAKDFAADAVLRGGDLIHVKAANKTTMGTLASLARIHRGYHCPSYSVGGNHDMSENDPSSIPRQPLGVLIESGVIRPLRDEVFTSGSMSVRVVGVEYTTDLQDDGLQEAVRKRPGDTYTVAVVHALAAYAPEERIQSVFGEKVFDYRDLVFEGCPDVYVFGHYHKDQGIREHMGVHFVNLGAVSRGALTFENLDRQPKVGLLKFDSRGVSVESLVIPHKDSADAFDLELKKSKEKEAIDLEDFISKLRQDWADSGDTPEANLRRFNDSPSYPDDLKEVVTQLMHDAESGSDVG
jgi:DNA repair exonuclease SbcCD nuclease subunit